MNSLKTAVIQFLLRRLDYKPEGSVASKAVSAVTVSSAEQEQIVRVALLPDASKAIDATLENLYPIEEYPFTSILHLDDVEEPVQAIVRKVLSAGSAIKMVRPDGEPRSYQVHSDFYRLLAQIRAAGDVSAPTSSAVLSNGLRDPAHATKIAAPTETDVRSALRDVAMGQSDFVILMRNADEHSDYIQTGAGPSPFCVECRTWLNDSIAEHFDVLDPKSTDTGYFADIDEVARVMLHWLRTGRLPNDVAVKNVTERFRQLEPTLLDTKH